MKMSPALHVAFSDWTFRFWTGPDGIIWYVISPSGSMLVPCLISRTDFMDPTSGQL